MKTVYEILINGRLYTGTMDEISKEIGYSSKHIRRIGKVQKVGYLLPEYKVLGKKVRKIVTGHIYDISKTLKIKPTSVKNLNPTPTGDMKFISLEAYERATDKKRQYNDMSVYDVRNIVGRMKYLNSKGAFPQWKPTAPMVKELKRYGLTYDEIKEVKC